MSSKSTDGRLKNIFFRQVATEKKLLAARDTYKEVSCSARFAMKWIIFLSR
jgi:hypothetical protein